MLLNLMKHLRPNIGSMNQELSKVNDKANPTVFCELVCMIGYVLNTNSFVLKLESWEITSNL